MSFFSLVFLKTPRKTLKKKQGFSQCANPQKFCNTSRKHSIKSRKVTGRKTPRKPKHQGREGQGITSQARKKSTKPNFSVQICSGGVGVFYPKGWGPKSSVRPSKPSETKLLGGISREFCRDIPQKSGIFAGISLRKVNDTFNFLRRAMRALWSVRPKCSHRCVSLTETSLKPVQTLKHTTKSSVEQTAMRTKWFQHIAI